MCCVRVEKFRCSKPRIHRPLAGSLESHKHFTTEEYKEGQLLKEELRHLVQSSCEYVCFMSLVSPNISFGCSELSTEFPSASESSLIS